MIEDAKLVRLLAQDGSWKQFEDDWREQCISLGEDFDTYEGTTFSVVRDIVETEEKKAGVFGLNMAGRYAAMCQVNTTPIKKYDSPVLRTRFMTLSPEYDLTDKPIAEYGAVLVGLLTEVLALAYLDPQLQAKHIKFHLRSPQDIPFFSAIGRSIKERDIFASVETRGMWLYISRK